MKMRPCLFSKGRPASPIIAGSTVKPKVQDDIMDDAISAMDFASAARSAQQNALERISPMLTATLFFMVKDLKPSRLENALDGLRTLEKSVRK